MLDLLKSKISAQAVRLFRTPLLRRFAVQREATAAVEFGIVAAPFIALTFATMQTGIIFFAGQTLESAAATAGRLVMTGQAQTQGWDAGQFKTQVCNAVTTMFNCQSSISIDVETYSSFAAVNLALPITNGTFNSSSLGYNPGGPGDIVVVRLYYQYPVYMNMLGLSNISGGYSLLAATAVFKNEPYAAS
ncbi:MAG TPA: TadE/TadG family type IV pilus assembly protein [Xanthobacteraceae bacterium]|nr:TadE/TadG family type IV pilus assembly protein [Xanthobacteraceae bacterium]